MDYYSIHDIITIKTNEKIPIPDYFKIEKKITDPDIEILRKNLVFNRPRDHKILRKDHYFWKKKSALFVDYAFLNVKLLINDLLGKVKVISNENFKRFSTDVSWEQLIMAILSIKLIQKRHTFIHSGSLSYLNDQAILIAGLRDTGKTSTILSLLDGEIIRFMSDDLTIVGENGLAYSYPREVKISPHTLTGKIAPAGKTLKRKILKSPVLSAFLEKFLKKETAEPMRIPDKWIDNKNPIRKVFLIKGYGRKGKLKKISKKEAAEAILTVSAETPVLLHKYLDLYFYSFGINFFGMLKKRSEILKKSIKNAKCYELTAPSIEKYPQMIRRVLEDKRY